MPLEHLPGVDPDRLRAAGGAAMGGVVYGLYTLVQMAKAGAPLSLRDYLRVGLNLLAALVAGVIAAAAVGPGIVGLIPWAGLRESADPVLIGFFIGAAGWEALPFVIERIKRGVSGRPSAGAGA